MTTYYLREKIPNGKEITIDFGENLNSIKQNFQNYSSNFPQNKYKILKKETITSVVLESEDCRQSLFSFV
jgi:hypothetical protein